MDKEGMNEHIFKEAVANLAETRPGDMAEQTTYLGLIANSMACIADSLEKMSDHMTADPFKKVMDEYSSDYFIATGEEEHRK